MLLLPGAVAPMDDRNDATCCSVMLVYDATSAVDPQGEVVFGNGMAPFFVTVYTAMQRVHSCTGTVLLIAIIVLSSSS